MSHYAASTESLRRALATAAVTLSLKAEEIEVSAIALERRLETISVPATREREKIEAFLVNIRRYQRYLRWVTERLHLEAAHCTDTDSARSQASDIRAFCLSVCDQIQAQLHYCQGQIEQQLPPSSTEASGHGR